MNKRCKYISIAVARVATAMFFIATIINPTEMTAAKRNTSTDPDFAYPETVQKNAKQKLSAAIAANNWSQATLAIIQNITASNIISRDSVVSNLKKLDGYIQSAPDQWKPVLQLVEADIYNSIYNSMRWKADQRKLYADSIPPNPYDWSRDMFATRIFSLCGVIIANRDIDNKPLKEWGEITVNNDMAIKYGMTINEFLLMKCTELLNVYADETDDVIPFFKNATTAVTPGQKCRELRDKTIDMLIDMSSAGDRNMIEAEFLDKKADYMPYSLRAGFLMSAFEKLKDTEGSQILLRKLDSNVLTDDSGDHPSFMISKKQYVEMLKKSIAQFPDGQYVNALKNLLNKYISPSANIQYKSQYLTSSDISMNVTLTNCNQSYILIYDYSKYKNSEKSLQNGTVAANCPLVKVVKVEAIGTPPFNSNVTAEIGKLPFGTYAVLPSSTPNNKGIYPSIAKQTWRQPFTVSDISVMWLDCLDATSRVFVMNGRDGHPIEGATVRIYTRKNYSSDRILTATLTTNKEGYVTVAEKNCEVEAFFDGSSYSNNLRIYNTTRQTDTITRNRVSILPDRSIYHPGDSISAVFIAYSSKGNNLDLDTDREFSIELHDVNGETINSQSAITDRFGRATVNFRIPENGLLGNWCLYATDNKGKSYDYVYFQVADYVAPSFFIVSEDSENEVTAGEIVNLKGQVLTYSGMPLANANVRYTVRYQPPMRWWSASNATYDSSVTTDSEGKYVISLPTANLKNTQFEKGVFSVEVSATSPAGETQSGPSTRFGLGQQYIISSPSSGLFFEISDSIPDIAFNVIDILGNDVRKELKYILRNSATGEIAAEGVFDSPSLKLADKDYPSAKYNLDVSLCDDTKVKYGISFVLWRESDTTAPAGVKLWIPHSDIHATPENFKTYVTIGSGVQDRWIPIALSGSNKLMELKWLHINKENEKVPVVLPKGRDLFIMDVNFISDLDVENTKINFYGPEVANSLEIKTESFRDKISAGDNEHWKFRFDKKYGEVGEIPVMAVMTDAALNHLAPFRWKFRPYANSNFNYAWFSNNHDSFRYADFNLKNSTYLSWRSLYFPNLNDYGQGWGLRGYHDGSVVYAEAVTNEVLSTVQVTSRSYAAERKSAMVVGAMNDMAAPMKAESADEADGGVLEEQTVAGNGNQDESKQEDLRESEYPIAFFMPFLTTDKDGVVDINFTVPDFNTTWALQILGYDDSLQTAYKQLETVASKPVMVSTHAPRFVRTGDRLVLTATLFNNSGEKCGVRGRIELVNLIEGNVIASKDFKSVDLEAAGSSVIEMEWTVPSDVSSVGLRAYAEAKGHRDGEQTLIPVLPASSPVVESTPFWLSPEQDAFEIKLPKFKDTDQITLQYCDNPVWNCLTALPDLIQLDCKSNMMKAANLYCNAMAYHLISSNKSLKEGLMSMINDKDSPFAALRSNLEKDGNIKIAKLSETPWVNDAASETLRMSRLSSLLDDADAEKVISAQIEELRTQQSSSGGWSWCPDMRPASFVTRFILENFAMLSNSGILQKYKDTDAMITKAIGFVETELLRDYNKYHKKDESLGYMLGWLYVRSCFEKDLLPSGSVAKDLTSVYGKAHRDIAREWKDYTINNKALAAVLLWRDGNRNVASEILESLRQYASSSPEKGVWFDNLNSGFMGVSTLQTTSEVLQAFTEIKPSDEIIDGLRQWLILNRQVQDWGKNGYNTEVINSILVSGSDWTNDSIFNLPSIRLGSESIDIPAPAAMTGAFTVNLDARLASGKKLTIRRDGNGPAWGGVVSQYESPIEDVNTAEIPQLSIRKQIVALVDDGNGSLVPKEGIVLKKGMKVRVTLTITNDRNMEYMAVSDERSACLEPVDQLSHYTSTDGVWYYKEVRDAVTDLYIEFLPKGHHVISYDCNVSQDGDFSCGIATIQSQYSPLITAHSSGSLLHSK